LTDRSEASAPTPRPQRLGERLVLFALILVAAVANLSLAVANVALPSIGQAFDAFPEEPRSGRRGCSLGLAASVLYLGAIRDRYGRKMMLIAGTVIAIPFSLLAAWAPSEQIFFVARVGGGLSAGRSFPTTLALITALWSGPGRTKSIALWSGIGSGRRDRFHGAPILREADLRPDCDSRRWL
jgi:MFS family permease